MIPQDSIFDDKDLQPEREEPYYRLIGLLRIVSILAIVILFLASIVNTVTQLNFHSQNSYETGKNFGTIIGECFIILMLWFLIHYYWNQTRAELSRSGYIISKRKYRMYSIIFMLILYLIVIFSLVSIINDNDVKKIRLLSTIMAISFVQLPLLIFDIKYYMNCRRLN